MISSKLYKNAAYVWRPLVRISEGIKFVSLLSSQNLTEAACA